MNFFKSLFTIAVSSALLFSISANAQNRKQQYQNPEFVRLLHEDITRAGCNTNRYEFGPIHDTPAPKGYKPYYISHYGRHGSRYAWNSATYTVLKKVLDAAASSNSLTERGRELYEDFNDFYLEPLVNTGDLTDLGMEQHMEIARIMCEDFPEVFRTGERFLPWPPPRRGLS